MQEWVVLHVVDVVAFVGRQCVDLVGVVVVGVLAFRLSVVLSGRRCYRAVVLSGRRCYRALVLSGRRCYRALVLSGLCCYRALVLSGLHVVEKVLVVLGQIGCLLPISGLLASHVPSCWGC